jgi:D-proline reductase (dithiol) PrdB
MISYLRQIKDRALGNVFTRFPWLFRQWTKRSTFIHHTDVPWTPLKKKVSESKLALITTGGVHLKSQPPFNMRDSKGEATFREIPMNTFLDDLKITHNYYDHSDADKDINIVLPIERIQELKAAGDIGEINHRHFSFMGHIVGQHIDSLINQTAPIVARYLKEDSVDIVLLAPS